MMVSVRKNFRPVLFLFILALSCGTEQGGPSNTQDAFPIGDDVNSTPTPDLLDGATGDLPTDLPAANSRSCPYDEHNTGDNPCMPCSCTPEGEAFCAPAVDSTSCIADPNACTQGDRCVSGACLAGPPLELDDGNPCTSGLCVKGQLVQQLLSGSCSDGNPCTSGDRCVLGQCVPDALEECPDGACTTAGWCDPSIGECVYEPVADGTPCGPSEGCFSPDMCVAGSCQPGVVFDCNDGNPCTIDSCTDDGSCAHDPTDEGSICAPGEGCLLASTCQEGICASGAVLDCDDEDPCTSDSCTDDGLCANTAIAGCEVSGVTWNPMDKQEDIILSDGDLQASVTEDSVNNLVRANVGLTEGRWYWEISVVQSGQSGYNGVCVSDGFLFVELMAGCSSPGTNYKRNGQVCTNSDSSGATASSYGANDVVGVAVDVDMDRIYFIVNGVWQSGADPENLTGGLKMGLGPDTPIYPCINISEGDVYLANFGQSPFTYAPPLGFQAGIDLP